MIRIPTHPETIGDRIRRRRLALKLTQKDVAEAVRVDECSVFNWEANISQPDLRYIPAVIDFLGYNPLPRAETLSERLVRHRTSVGLSQKNAAKEHPPFALLNSRMFQGWSVLSRHPIPGNMNIIPSRSGRPTSESCVIRPKRPPPSRIADSTLRHWIVLRCGRVSLLMASE